MGTTDFDFLPGRWDVRNRRVTDMLDPECDTWEEFDATSDAEAYAGAPGRPRGGMSGRETLG